MACERGAQRWVVETGYLRLGQEDNVKATKVMPLQAETLADLPLDPVALRGLGNPPA